MYNRYTPTPSGQYQRKPVGQPERRSSPEPRQEHHSPAPQQPPSKLPFPGEAPPLWSSSPQPGCEERKGKSKLRIPFLDKLLPDFDTGDLLVLLILLLLMVDGEDEDSTSIMLTIAIFLFLQ